MEFSFYDLDPVYDKLKAWYRDTLDMLPNFVLAIIVMLLFYFLARLIKRLVRNILNRTYSNQELTSILGRIVYNGVIIAGVMAALSILHLDKTLTSILAGAGIIGLALSFAFQDIAANFVSGFFMALKRPFETGDVIEVEGHRGQVKSMSLRTTEIVTLDGNEVILPNRLLFENAFRNYSRTKLRRVELGVGVSYAEDLDKVESVILKAVRDIPRVITNDDSKPISVLYNEFGDSSINMQVFYWVTYDSYLEFLESISQGVKVIKKSFDANDIVIPFPIRTLNFDVKGGSQLHEQLDRVNGKKE